MFAGLYADPDDVLDTTFDEQHDELVMINSIPLYSTCEHRWWSSTVSRMWIHSRSRRPGHRIVENRAPGRPLRQRPQLQERLTAQIADALMRKLDPRGVIVIIEAEHLCMSMRGVRKPGAVTTTSAVRGQFKSDSASRAEALELILRK